MSGPNGYRARPELVDRVAGVLLQIAPDGSTGQALDLAGRLLDIGGPLDRPPAQITMPRRRVTSRSASCSAQGRPPSSSSSSVTPRAPAATRPRALVEALHALGYRNPRHAEGPA